MLHQATPDIDKHLNKSSQIGYIGFDPTSDSMHIGNLVQIMILIHFQRYGHKPIALIGGATGMIGDPSGKSSERKLLDQKKLEKNSLALKKQFLKFLDFSKLQQKQKLFLLILCKINYILYLLLGYRK